MNLPLQALNLWRFASTDPSRPTLHHVHFERDGDTMHAVATSGTYLGHVSWSLKQWQEESEHSCVPPDGCSLDIPAATMKLLASAAKKEKRDRVTIEQSEAHIYQAHTSDATIRVSLIEDSHFPAWRQVVPTEREITLQKSITWDISLLKTMDAYMKDCKSVAKCSKSKDLPLSLVHATDPLDLAVWELPYAANDVEIEIVVMPMKI